MILFEKLINYYLKLNRLSKSLTLLAIDILIIIFSITIIIEIFGTLGFSLKSSLDILGIFSIIFVLHLIYFYYFKIYLEFARFVSNVTYFNIIKANLLVFISINLLSQVSNYYEILILDIKYNILYLLLSTLLFIVFRSLSKDLYEIYKKNKNNIPKSILLIESDKIEDNFYIINKFNVKIIICPNTNSQSYISGIKVIGFNKAFIHLSTLKMNSYILIIQSKKVLTQYENLIDSFKKIFTEIKLLDDTGVNTSKLTYFDITKKHEFGRINLNKKQFENRTILVTGGAGSIGSELCKIILKENIKKLIILDNSELNIYKLQNDDFFKKIESIEYKLLDVTDKYHLSKIFLENKIDIVYHIAAYKHVNIIENQVHSAVKNNIIGTLNILELSYDFSINKFIFVSTDKAVKPINVLGYTKRFGEILTLYFSKLSMENKKQVSFNCVRFGNVFGSSGSVIPHFENELQNKRNLKVKHLDLTRYYMSINEAASLVILAMNLETKGEIIVFDMGEPIKIIDIAKNILELNKEKNYDFDAKIEITNLDKFEKVNEDLFYNKPNKTKFNKIELETQKINNFDYLIKCKNEIIKIMNNNKTRETELFNIIKDFSDFYNKSN